MLNKVTLIGNLGKDPDTRQTDSGAVCKFSVATSHSVKQSDGSWGNATEWHNVVAFGRQAENCGKYLAKGRQVYVEGRISTKKYTNKDGHPAWMTEIVAKQVLFMRSEPAEVKKEPTYDNSWDNDIPF